MALLEFDELNHARILVIGAGGGGGNAINTMIASNLDGVEFVDLLIVESAALRDFLAERDVDRFWPGVRFPQSGAQEGFGAMEVHCVDLNSSNE